MGEAARFTHPVLCAEGGTRMAKIFKAWLFFQERIVGALAAVLLLLVTVFAVTQVLSRYILGHTFHWGQDTVTYIIVSATFVYFGASQAKRAHLAVTALPDWLRAGGKTKLALAMRAFALLCVVLFVGGFLYWGLPGAYRTWRMGTVSESLALPMWPFQYALLIGVAMMGITALFQFYRDVMKLFGKDVFPWETDYDELEL
jgi:TRAP-type C4-dicarboxylate transport system permease small subunit